MSDPILRDRCIEAAARAKLALDDDDPTRSAWLTDPPTLRMVDAMLATLRKAGCDLDHTYEPFGSVWNENMNDTPVFIQKELFNDQ